MKASGCLRKHGGLEGKRAEKALVERHARELNEHEDRVQSLPHELTRMQHKRDAAQSTLNEMVEALLTELTWWSSRPGAARVEEPVIGGPMARDDGFLAGTDH